MRLDFLTKFQMVVCEKKLYKDTIDRVMWCLQAMAAGANEENKRFLQFPDKVKMIMIAKSVVQDATKKSEGFADALATLKSLSDNADDRILTLIGCGDMPSCLINLHAQYFGDLQIHMLVLRILANLMTTSKKDVVQKLIFHGVLDRLHADMQQTNFELVCEACWSCGNLACDFP